MNGNTVILGLQWGDEGKGKIVDLLSEGADIVARFQGGANAGHTVIVEDKKYVLHLLPSGILHENKICYIGNGVALDPFEFAEEVRNLESQGIKCSGRLFVSAACHLALPFHKLIDELQESDKGSSIGTTLRGIGPVYRDKAERVGIRLMDIFDDETLRRKLQKQKIIKAGYFQKAPNDPRSDMEETMRRLIELRQFLKPMVVDVSIELSKAAKEGKRIIFEGAQGAMLDLDHGAYPYVTSSNTTIGAVLTGLGIGPKMIDEVIGVTKAYATRVGNGPFPTELENEMGESLRKAGNEFGATTGRPRRTGWIDLVALRQACRVNGVDKIAVTKLDVLDGLEKIKACVAYRIDGKETTEIPADLNNLEKVEPVYKEFPGWNAVTASILEFNELPQEARRYVNFIADELEVGIKLVSTGAARAESILV
ncbi:MAG: adenylosuccinate synthase [candidate division Zixibacteria bacterium]|nr:adenylosuccinate synthase [candidate division Zixibacteria bacterium]